MNNKNNIYNDITSLEIINSKSNSKVKFVKSLNEKKYRQKENAFYIEGIKVVSEVLDINLKNKINLKYLYICKQILENANGGNELLQKIEKYNNKLNIYNIDADTFKYMTDTVTPQGVLAVIEIPKYNISECLNNDIIVLDKLQDLGNIGTIVRTANAFNINTILCMQGSADIYSPKGIRSTMASILKTKIIYFSDYDKIFKILKNNGYNIIGTSLKGKNFLNQINLKSTKNCFCMGSEANGISLELEKMCDTLIKIPIKSTVESLNVAIATGIILYKNYIDKL